MGIDPALAAKLGFPKLKYAWTERERRWLCGAKPVAPFARAERVSDLYIDNARLRLREAVPLGGGEIMRRLTRKADISGDTRLITSIYLSAEEFALFAGLKGRRLVKMRYSYPDLALSVDVFEGALAGLILAEAEFESDAAMASFAAPPFAVREVTSDARYRGGALASARHPPEEAGANLAAMEKGTRG